MSSLQDQAGAWHTARFPEWDQFRSITKLTEEFGEVAEVVTILDDPMFYADKANKFNGLGQEAADVVLGLMVLLARFYPEYDLMYEVQKKLTRLQSGDHRASLK